MIDYDSFSHCLLTDIFFAFHAGAKELKQKVYLPVFAPNKIFLNFHAMKVLLLPELSSKFQGKLLLQERVLRRESLSKNACYVQFL